MSGGDEFTWEESAKKGIEVIRKNLQSSDPTIVTASRKALRDQIAWLQNKREEIGRVVEDYQQLLSGTVTSHIFSPLDVETPSSVPVNRESGVTTSVLGSSENNRGSAIPSTKLHTIQEAVASVSDNAEI